MPIISEAASTLRSRFGFHQPSESDAVRSSPAVPRSTSRGNLFESHFNSDKGEDRGALKRSSSQSYELDLEEDPNFWKNHNVQVIIRVRPLSNSEISLQGNNKCVKQDSFQTITWIGHPESRFTFDLIADESVTQEKLFKVAGLPMVENCMGGYNSCMFAYGQTGSGKTHTMLGDIEGGTRRHSVNCGMTPRVFEHLFSRIQKVGVLQRAFDINRHLIYLDLQFKDYAILDWLGMESQMQSIPFFWLNAEHTFLSTVTRVGDCWMETRGSRSTDNGSPREKESRREEKLRFTCKCSFLEIYNEQILDLLDPSSVNLQLREDAKKGVYVENLKEMEVTSSRDVIQQLLEGAANRKVAATNMNLASSRSHSVFTCIIESQWESQGVIHHRFARLNLVDLAGSERQKSSGAEGDRLKEATNINKSLSTLGLVIMNLVNISNGRSQHVPYRDSKLTFLLQDSLGGNSKTTIIANISPSTCCSLETLSTLKFAQRAKFIKNNAIVNEDASGDVLTMRLQIQQLKKEVSRLRGLVDGETVNQENDSSVVSFPGSPGPFKWDGLNGSFSPLASGRRISQVQKKEFETALVGAFRRERDKEIALQSLTAENEAAMHLAKQREDEIQSLKLRLRFREAGIKRLEGVAAGKLSAEGHLLQEREEHMKEIEVLRNQLDKNQEVTRFAMENLRLKEEIRRLKSFYEEGERERMNEQIMVLQNKLLEALDWKLMHESDPGLLQKGSSDLESLEDSLLTSNKEPKPTGNSSIEVENEFLRLQAIQNQSEMETLHRKLNTCLEEKEKLDRRVKDLVMELEEEKRLAENIKEEVKLQVQVDLQTNSGIHNHLSDAAVSDPVELKTMVDAIAVASQQEAEAHETAINLAKENEELRAKIKVLIEDNNKLIELYETAVAEASMSKDSKEGKVVSHSNGPTEFPNEADTDRTAKTNKPGHQLQEMHAKDAADRTIKIEQLEQQLEDMHEENEKLMALYEKAMQDRDDYKRMFNSSGQLNAEVKELVCIEKFVEVDNSEKLKFDRLPLESDDAKMSSEQILSTDIHESGVCIEDPHTEGKGQIDVQASVGASTENFDQIAVQPDAAYVENSDTKCRPSNFPRLEVPEELNLARNKLEKVNDKLVKATKDLTFFGSLEKVIMEVDALSKQIEVAKKGVAVKQRELVDLTSLSFNMEKQKHIVDNKLSAMKSLISCIASSVFYWEEREARKRKNVASTTKYVEQKREKLANLQDQMDENEAAQQTAQRCAVDLRNTSTCLKSKLEEENLKKESEKVLFRKENLDTTNIPAHLLGGKATDLLKSEEERTKLHNEMKQTRERLNIMLKETERLTMKSEKLKTEMQTTEGELSIALQSMKEMELAHEEANEEKVMISEMIEDGRKEVEKLIVEYSGCVSGLDLKLGEIQILEEELQVERKGLEKLREGIVAATRKELQILEDARCSFMATNEQSQNWCVSEMIEEELQEISLDLQAVKSLLASNVCVENLSVTSVEAN